MRIRGVITNVKKERAFTLVELLVTVAIIGILAALLLTALSRSKAQSYRVQCVNNQKQIGMAIELYAGDHQDQLPGPAWQGFYDTYDNTTNTWRVLFYIATYLGMPSPSATPQTAMIARCPAAARAWTPADADTDPMAQQRPLSYIVSVSITNINSGTITRPFGYPYQAPPFGQDTNEAPKRIQDIANPSLSWCMVDADQENAVPLASYYSFLPETPCHGDVRNNLYFDWHVDAIRATNANTE